MRYLYYIIPALLLLLPVWVYANECSQTCEISDAPAPALTEYFANLEAITSNIVSGISDAEDEDDDDRPSIGDSLELERNRVMAAMNSILSFGDYFGSFDYYITLPITQEVPAEVRRDHDRIVQQTERLTTLLETNSRRGRGSVIITDVCNGVSYCNFGEENAQAILTAVIQNNQKVAQLYRSSILDRPDLATDRSFILVADDFISQIESNYNRDTLTSCSSCEEGFLGTIRERIQDISFKNSDYTEGVQKWKDAWAMLMGGGSSNLSRDREESEATEEYLQSQGVESGQSDIIVTNIDRYGEAFSSLDPTMNSYFNSTAGHVNQALNDHQVFLQTLEEAERNDEGNIPYLEMVRVNAQSQDEEDIAGSIATLYEDQLPYAFVQDTAAADLQARIIRMHFDLVYTANLLGEQTSRTERLCNKQATGRGRCEY